MIKNLENEEAKTRYRAVKNTNILGCNARKTNKRTDATYTRCPRRNVPNFGREFLMLHYADITQNTYIQS